MGMNLNKEDKKSILRTLITLSIPTILEEILSTLLQYVDTAMVGHLGERATASVSVTTTITWIVNSIPHAFAIAALALIAKAVGAKDDDMVKNMSKNICVLVLACTVITMLPSLILCRRIPVLMGAEKDVVWDAGTYFMIISIPLLFRISSIIFGAAIRATGDTKTPMLVNFGANILNAGLNGIFIYGLGLGVVGAAIGSALSYTVCGIFMYVFYRKNKLLHWNIKEFGVHKESLKETVKIGMPLFGTSITTCLGYAFFAGIVSGMGTAVFAAHSIAVTAEQLFYIPGYGLRTATSTMVGMALGEQNGEKLEYVTRISTVITVLMMFISGIVLYFCAYPLMRLFTNGIDTARLGARMLRLVAFSEPFFGLMIVLEGLFNGLGKNQYAFIIETGSMWGIRILFTFLCVKVWNLPLQYVWYCMIADNICKAVLLWVVKRKKLKNIIYRSNLS